MPVGPCSSNGMVHPTESAAPNLQRKRQAQDEQTAEDDSDHHPLCGSCVLLILVPTACRSQPRRPTASRASSASPPETGEPRMPAPCRARHGPPTGVPPATAVAGDGLGPLERQPRRAARHSQGRTSGEASSSRRRRPLRPASRRPRTRPKNCAAPTTGRQPLAGMGALGGKPGTNPCRSRRPQPAQGDTPGGSQTRARQQTALSQNGYGHTRTHTRTHTHTYI